jgi:hypothetical protein
VYIYIDVIICITKPITSPPKYVQAAFSPKTSGSGVGSGEASSKVSGPFGAVADVIS